MLIFTWILFHKESNNWIYTIGFSTIALVVVTTLIAIYNVIMFYIEDIEMDHIVNADPTQILNPIILPFALCSMGLNHYAGYARSLDKMKNGTYQSGFIKRFFMRHILILGLVLVIVFSYIYFNIGIIIALIGVKAVLRTMNKKIRKFT